MQRAGKFPGILETFHGKFRNFEEVGIFGNFGNFQFRLFSTFYEIVCTQININ